MECTFQVGDKVVCIDASDTNSVRRRELIEGGIYTVREVTADGRDLAGVLRLGPYGDVPGIRLVEINPRNSTLGVPRDTPFAAARFRHTKSISAHGKQAREKELA